MPRSAPSPVRRAQLAALPEFDVNLIHYAAGHSQSRHEHSRASFAVVLAGSLTEEVDGRDHAAGPGQASLKPSQVVHSDRYGRDGALLLSFVFRCEETAERAVGQRGWKWRHVRSDAPVLATNMFREVPYEAFNDVLWDCLAATDRHAPAEHPPAWLCWAKSELDRRTCPPEIAELAKDAGVHRVHFSREFVRHYGLAPSVYRQRQMTGRALNALLHDRLPAAAAAQEAGFVDQSHLARAIRSRFGTTPRRMAALFGG
jgi:AraC family transcriptional regulator